jgi:hypothetical protein
MSSRLISHGSLTVTLIGSGAGGGGSLCVTPSFTDCHNRFARGGFGARSELDEGLRRVRSFPEGALSGDLLHAIDPHLHVRAANDEPVGVKAVRRVHRDEAVRVARRLIGEEHETVLMKPIADEHGHRRTVAPRPQRERGLVLSASPSSPRLSRPLRRQSGCRARRSMGPGNGRTPPSRR